MLQKARYLLFISIASYLAWNLFFAGTSWGRDLLLYNFIWLIALAIVIAAPLSVDRIAIAAIALAISFWGASSLTSSIVELLSPERDLAIPTALGYSLFYPLLLLAIPRIFTFSQKLAPLELLDALIVGLGLTSILAAVGSAFLFPENLYSDTQDFFLIFYPLGDLALLMIALTPLVTTGRSIRNITLMLGICIFTATDFYYLWLALNSRYSFGQAVDAGWLLAIALIAISTTIPGEKINHQISIHPALVALAIFISPILLAISALAPGTFPSYILLPSIANLLLAFIRMNSALRQARTLGDERILARTDELTGLANRRRLLAEIDGFSSVEGALMLLDLNEFKPVNDQYGHEVGDLVLREVARRFARSLPEGALLARLGGDEFGVLVKGGHEETLDLAYALRACLTYPCTVNGKRVKVGVSIGYVQNDGAGDLLKRADDAMYRAKQLEQGVAQS